MFGTIARLKVKPGQEAALREVQDQWWRERKPKVNGAITGYVCKPVDGPADEQFLFVVFDSKENYFANANDPEQDAWYQNFRACLQADPEWTDVEIAEALKG